MIVVSGNVRRCKPENTLIFCRNGLRKIQEVQIGEEVLTSKGYRKVLDNIYQGEQSLVKIYTGVGPSYCTPDHRMAVLESPTTYTWKHAKNLTQNDLLAFNTTATEGIEMDSNVNTAWFFGYVHGNGSIYNKGYRSELVVTACNTYPQIIEKIKREMRCVGSEPLEYYYDNGIIKISCIDIPQHFFQFKKSYIDITIPEFIMNGEPEIRAAYLAGLFDADEATINPLHILSTSSETSCAEFLVEIQSIYASLGIPVINRNRYDLRIIGKYSKDLWRETVGKFSSKCQLTEYKENDKEKDFSFPEEWVGGVMNMYEYKEKFNSPKFIPIQVFGVEQDCKIAHTFDLTVEGEHEYFCAEGLLNHNSAQICLGDGKDQEYLNAKNWASGVIPNWRAYSNNSVICNDINEILENKQFWEGYNGNGEPYGLINLKLSKSCGRLNDTQYKDPEVEGYNPCLTGDTLILTTEGLQEVKSLVNTRFTAIVNGAPYTSTDNGFWNSGYRTVYKIKLENGQEIKATDNHKFAVKTGFNLYDWKEVSSLNIGEKMVLCDNSRYEFWLSSIARYINIGKLKDNTVHHAGIFGDHAKLKKYTENLQLYLLACGITSKDQGDYLLIEKSYIKYARMINRPEYDVEDNDPEEYCSLILSITRYGEEDVYDCTIKDVHCFSANGMLSHNCAEQSLSNYETCCLGELYLPNIKTKEELFKCSTYIYRICKHSLALPCTESEETESIVHKNMRMGIGVTGYLQSTDEQKSWLSECYNYLRQYDKEYSRENGFSPSIKLTTCKPSGCSRQDMLIQTDKGLLRLDEIGNVNGEAWQTVDNLKVYTDSGRLEKVTKFHVNGYMPTKKLTTLNGNILESTHSHRFRVFEGLNYVWKSVRDIKIGDKLLVCIGSHPKGPEVELKRVENLKQPSILDKNVANFLGFFYGHGICNNERIIIEDDYDRLMQCSINIEVMFGSECCLYENNLRIVGDSILKWMKLNCFEMKNLPRLLRVSSIDIVQEFINSFWPVSKRSKLFFPKIQSESFMRELLVLFRSAGYNIKIGKQGEKWYILENITEIHHGIHRTDEIVSIENSSCPTYDIEVENVHHYRLGGVVSHNTLSLLGNCTSGVHPGFARYYRRRIRIASESSLIKVAKEHGYPIEFVKNFDGSVDHTTQIISFPCSLPENTVLAENCTAIQQLEWVKKLQTEWSDNAVSVTVYYKKHELDEIKEWLRLNYNDSVKSVSFLLHSEHGFQQAPLEQMTRGEFEEMYGNCKQITNLSGICYTDESYELINQGECVGGACPMR